METLIGLFSKGKEILAEMGGYYDDSRMIIYVTLAVMGITLLTHLIFKKIRIMKYLPGLIVLGIGLFNLYRVKDTITADASLVNLLLFIIGTVAGLVGILFDLIIGTYVKPVKRKRQKAKIKEAQKPDEKTQEKPQS